MRYRKTFRFSAHPAPALAGAERGQIVCRRRGFLPAEARIQAMRDGWSRNGHSPVDWRRRYDAKGRVTISCPRLIPATPPPLRVGMHPGFVRHGSEAHSNSPQGRRRP